MTHARPTTAAACVTQFCCGFEALCPVPARQGVTPLHHVALVLLRRSSRVRAMPSGSRGGGVLGLVLAALIAQGTPKAEESR